MSITTHIMERKGCPLHYCLSGSMGKPLVILSHGLGLDHRAFTASAEALAPFYRVLNWDIRGHGQSQPMGEPYTVALAVEDLLAIMDELGYQQAILVGHSNGSYISQELAFRHPERVQALVVVDGTCITWPRSPLFYPLMQLLGPLTALFPYEWLKRSGLSANSANPAIQEYAYQAFSQIGRADFIQLCKATSLCFHAEPGYQIRQPFLLMHGDADTSGDIRQIAPKWAAHEPNCTYMVIPNARHIATLDNPAFFNQQLLAFLTNLAS